MGESKQRSGYGDDWLGCSFFFGRARSLIFSKLYYFDKHLGR
jgi:hypothetical protein